MKDNYNLSDIAKIIEQSNQQVVKKYVRYLNAMQNKLYTQLESLSWLQRQLALKKQLPPLRGWAASPDVLLKLHTFILQVKPIVVVELGSGVSTLVIADALRQNGIGKLISIEHSENYGEQVLANLREEHLGSWVDLRVSDLEPWLGEHLNPNDSDKVSKWYSRSLLEDIECIDLLWVDGPPGSTCLFSRYPALPALIDRLSSAGQVWMDDTMRQEEKDICQYWSESYGFDLEFFSLDKGLGVLTRK